MRVVCHFKEPCALHAPCIEATPCHAIEATPYHAIEAKPWHATKAVGGCPCTLRVCSDAAVVERLAPAVGGLVRWEVCLEMASATIPVPHHSRNPNPTFSPNYDPSLGVRWHILGLGATDVSL